MCIQCYFDDVLATGITNVYAAVKLWINDASITYVSIKRYMIQVYNEL